jgi:hypothetical protein
MSKSKIKNLKAFLFIEEERFVAPAFKQLQEYVNSLGYKNIEECIEKKEEGSLEKFISSWYKSVEYPLEYRKYLKENNVYFYLDDKTPQYYHVEICDSNQIEEFNLGVKDGLIYFNSKVHTFYSGQTVEHKDFGIGKVVSFTGNTDSSNITVEFEKVGRKTLMISYAKLKYEEELPFCIANISIDQKLVIDLNQEQLKIYAKAHGYKTISSALENWNNGSWENLSVNWFNSIQRPDFYSDYLKLNNIYYASSDNAESQANLIENEQDFLDLKEGDGGLIFN